MRRVLRWALLVLLMLLLPAALTGTAAAAEVPDYSITYTVTVADDGSALWHVEYRTLLLTAGDVADFEAYTADLAEVYLPEFRGLMERSAAQAAAATGRSMEIGSITGNAIIQESPTGRYGIVLYTALWEGFVRPAATITIGDAFTGGMYLDRGNTLVIRIPDGYTVAQVLPEPDVTRDGLVWSGPRLFGAGEPRVVLEPQAFPLFYAASGLILLFVIVIAGAVVFRRRSIAPTPSPDPAPGAAAGTASLEDRIVHLLKSQGGELFQSDIVRMTALPRSTVSTVLNDIHARGLIVKVKKGRENLIRLSTDVPSDEGY
ncbi:MAG: transcriptional regulator [Methanomicrobiaceae archaeon]|nr:transcriptional regulator [Methanomicrobiaceae archaeon]